jgi:hypothetical protein
VFGAAVAKHVVPLTLVRGGGAAGPVSGGDDDGGVHCEVEVRCTAGGRRCLLLLNVDPLVQLLLPFDKSMQPVLLPWSVVEVWRYAPAAAVPPAYRRALCLAPTTLARRRSWCCSSTVALVGGGGVKKGAGAG